MKLPSANLDKRRKKRFKLGHELTVQVKYFPVIEDNQMVSRIWLFEDVTIQSLTESNMAQREEKYRGILENMELGILEVDNDGIVVRAYDRFLCDDWVFSIRINGQRCT